ncbi:MAG: VOC family protein [Flavobacteriales bacterium]|nr:VOC family protein [Flavobacteriales bacterium]
MTPTNNHIDYVEFKTHDIARTKSFYQEVFGWEFTDYGPTYVSFNKSGLNGGFELTDKAIENGALIVFYHEDLERVLDAVKTAGAVITRDIFSFPGGRRFHFSDHSGNELSVWTDK